MKESSKEFLIFQLQKCLPLFLSLLFILLEHIKLNFGVSEIYPKFGLACAFFWLTNRPDFFNLFSTCILGVFSDLLGAIPFGIHLFTFMLLYILATKIARYISNKLFEVNWLCFAILLLTIMSVQWIIVCLYYGNLFAFLPVFFSWILTGCLYPLLATFNMKIARKALPEEDFLYE